MVNVKKEGGHLTMSKAELFAGTWMRHRGVLEEIVSKVKTEDLSFAPWDGALTFKDLVIHTVGSTDFFVTAVKDGKTSAPAGGQPEINDAQALQQFVKDMTAKTKATILSLEDAQFEAMVDATVPFGTHIPGSSLLHMMRDHEIHHKGQMFTYGRMVGMETMPSFVQH